MEDEVLPILKYSYDNLKGEQVKSCLLYCALFPEDEKISKSNLIEYWICEGIIDDREGMEKAEYYGYEIIGSLVRSSLLIEEDKLKVYMHDIVREMALWIAFDFGKQEYNFVVHAGADLYEIPKFKNMNYVKRISLMSNKIDHISGCLECAQLTTLFLQRNKKLGSIFAEFFKSMPKLVVLDFSCNGALTELPDEISELVSLKYLNMSDTGIECLPVGLQKLKNLIHLDLEKTDQLSNIVGVSALLNLKVLKLCYSGLDYSSKTKEELKVLEHLEILTISIKSDSGLDEFLSSHNLMCCTQVLNINVCQLESSAIWCLARMEKLRELSFEYCTISEIKMDTASITFFSSVFQIEMFLCICPKELTWLSFIPNLAMLQITGENHVEEIINKEKDCEGGGSSIVPFHKQEYLYLEHLAELKSIYYKPLDFPCLKELRLVNCPKLRKLPLNSKSGEKGLVINYYSSEWIEEVEWEDEATKARFLSSSSLTSSDFV